MRRNGVRYALLPVGERGHQMLLLRLSILLRNALATCGPLITPGKCYRKITWPEFQPSLPPGLAEQARVGVAHMAPAIPIARDHDHASPPLFLALCICGIPPPADPRPGGPRPFSGCPHPDPRPWDDQASMRSSTRGVVREAWGHRRLDHVHAFGFLTQ